MAYFSFQAMEFNQYNGQSSKQPSVQDDHGMPQSLVSSLQNQGIPMKSPISPLTQLVSLTTLSYEWAEKRESGKLQY